MNDGARDLKTEDLRGSTPTSLQRHRRTILLGGASIVAALTLVAGAAAASGDPDPGFGAAGVVRTDIGLFDNASDLAVQPDGKIVAAGTVDQNGTRNVVLARYTADGSLDADFGTGGIVVPERFHQVAPRMAVQSDGKIVLATRGESVGGPAFLYRFGADGLPDTGFGTAGTAVLTPPFGSAVARVAGVDVRADGKIVVGVWAGGASVGFARFDPDGTPDATFGSGGFISIPRDRMWLPLAFELQSDGRMLVAGYLWLPDSFLLDGFVARFLPDGTLDPNFDTDGIAIVSRPSNPTEFQALTVTPDGSIVAGGRQFGSIFNQSQWLLARFTSGGALDSTFGSSGLTLFDPGNGDDAILDVAATSAGIYATGSTETLSAGLPFAHFRSDGALDPSVGTAGLAGLADQFTRGAVRLDVQSDGKVVVFGSVQSFVPTFNQDLYLARYEGAVRGTVPPVLHLPDAVTADAVSPDGATVDYASLVSATDDVDGGVPVSCSPPSGGVFQIGTTPVTCTATDAAGNSTSASFGIHVKGAAEQLADLEVGVAGVGPGTSLAEKVAAARAEHAAGESDEACELVAAFARQVSAQSGKSIEQARADELLATAARIRAVLAC